MKTRLGITLGDPAGIGPEIVAKALAAFDPARADVRVYARPGDFALPGFVAEDASLPNPGKDEESRAAFCVAALTRAADDARAGKIDALVTAPLDKAVVRRALPDFSGHTEFLGARAGVPRTVMLLDNGDASVVLLTNHIALRDVAKALSVDGVLETVEIARASLAERLGWPDAEFTVLGLNPHAGEITPDAEEDRVLRPAIAALRARGVRVDGPAPADGHFAKAERRRGRVTVACYHDQGLVPVKYPGADKVVNVTLGLPYLRVSPGHGVAYDIAGRGKADPRSFERALEVALTGRLR